MSSIDQAFVKAFSRRSRGSGTPEAPTGRVRTAPAPAAQAPAAQAPAAQEPAAEGPTKHVPTAQVPSAPVADTEEIGALKLDPSVSASASVWVDPIENEIARADHSDVVPKPHVGRVDRKSGAKVNEAEKTVQSESVDEQLRSLQTTTYASVEISDEIAESLRVPVIGDDELPMRHDTPAIVETRIDPPVQKVPGPPTSKSPLAAPPAPSHTPETPAELPESDATESVVEETAAEEPDAVSENVAAAASETSVNQVAPATVPFRAAWEVDVFEIPNEVADLFFEGQLFQQIAERMLDAVATGLNSMLVTSLQRGEGRSSVAIGLAMAAAAAGLRVALVDGDSDHPSLADDLRLDLPHGWTEATRNGLPVKEVAVHAVEDGVTLFPLLPPQQSGDAATAKESSQLLKMLENRFDLVIVDGPASDSGKAESWAEAFDSAIIVCDPSRTTAAAINTFAGNLDNAGIQGIGMVENFV